MGPVQPADLEVAVPAPRPPSVDGAAGLTPEDLRSRYDGYRRRQAARLLRMIPREAIRPLHRRALAVAARGGAEERDPLAVLVDYCTSLLPLPPFDVWCEDFRRNPAAHEDDLAGDGGGGPSADAPSTLDARGFTWGGTTWEARLQGFRDGSAWRGVSAFRGSSGGAEYRTAPVFHEDGPGALRERFHAFDHAALAAFLRSTLP